MNSPAHPDQRRWHVPEALLARFASDPAGLDAVAAASVESHLLACARCRGELSATAEPASLERSWVAVADMIDRPSTRPLERLLARLGLPEGMTRLLVATPALRLAGLLSIALTALGAAAASRVAEVDGPFLVVAPLVPLAAVALSFAAAAEPAGEAGVATPLWGAGLALRRSVAVLAVSFVTLALASFAVPHVTVGSLGWVLPAVALSLAALALTTWVRAEVAVAVLGGLWLALVVSTRLLVGAGTAFVDSVVFSPGGQLVAMAASVVSALAIAGRRGRFATLEAFR